jgi:chromate reductase
VWPRKPAAIITLSQGAIGGFGANHHLRQTFVFNDIPALAQPEAYIGNASKLFDAAGKVAREDTQELLRKFMSAFGKWIDQISR